MDLYAVNQYGRQTGLMMRLQDSETNPLPYKLSPFTLEHFLGLMVEQGARPGAYLAVFIDARANVLKEEVILALVRAFGATKLEVNGIWMFYWRAKRSASYMRFRKEVKPYVMGNINFRKKLRLVRTQVDDDEAEF